MADDQISGQACPSNSKVSNQLSGLTDDQLLKLRKAIQAEIELRCKKNRTRDNMAAKLKAEKLEIPAIYFKVTDDHLSHRAPSSLRKEHFTQPPICGIKYLKRLLMQDWSFLWPNCCIEKRFCVYAHVDPTGQIYSFAKSMGGACRTPFYIGKGTLNRAYDLNRNQGHGIKIRQLLAADHAKEDIV